MTGLKERVYARATGRSTVGTVDLSWPALLAYYWERALRPRARGLCTAWRFGACGRRLLIGRRVRLQFAGYIHAGDGVSIGDDSYISAYATRGVRLGHGVRIREGAWIQCTSRLDEPGVGLTIGDGTYIGPRCLIGAGGGVTIGRRTTFGAGVHVLAENHEFRDGAALIQDQGVTRAGITIGDDVWIGNNVIVLDGVHVGSGAVIGAGSVVTRHVADRAVAVGNPARVIDARDAARG